MQVKNKEWYAVILSFLYYFCILAGYYVMRPIRDQFAAEAGSNQLPIFFTATFIGTLVLTPLFAWLVSRWPRKVIMPVVYMVFIICQLVFILLFNNKNLFSIQTFGLIFFVWVSLFNLFAVSVFWSFMTDIWSDIQARQYFPIIAIGGTAGAVIGPLITSTLVEIIGLSSLLIVSTLLLFMGVICIILLGNWAHEHGANRDKTNNEAALEGSMLDGLKQIFTNPFIRCIAFMMLLSDAIATIAYVLITDYSGSTFPNDPIAQTRFAAHIDLSTNIIQIVVQLTITRWLLVSYGAGVVFTVWASIIVFACLAMTVISDPYAPIIGAMPAVALTLIITRSLSFGMLQSARETLYTLVPRNLRYKGKNAVDTVVWRAGDIISLMAINSFKALGIKVAGLGIIWATFAALSGLIGSSLANRAEKGEFENENP